MISPQEVSVKWVPSVLGTQCSLSKLEGAVAPCSGDEANTFGFQRTSNAVWEAGSALPWQVVPTLLALDLLGV